MKHTLRTISLVAALSGFALATHAQLVVWSAPFDSEPLGPYGTATHYDGTSWPTNNIVVDTLEGGGTNQAEEITFQAFSGSVINWQTAGNSYPASGNTNTLLANYTLSFDMAWQGVDAGPFAQGFQISIFGPGGGTWSGPKAELDLTTNVFTAGAGYQHYSFTLDKFNQRSFDPTTNSFTVGFGCVWYGDTMSTPFEAFDIDNLQITMKTNPPPPPNPIMSVLPAKPGLRIFGQNYAFTYNQEGIGTVDPYQSWVGATPSLPKSYSITFADFDTVDSYSFYAQFAPNGSVNPWVVFTGANSLTWRITHMAAGFTTGISWKTNLPSGNENNTALTLTTTSTNGRGTWTLTFTNDTDGTVTAPDGTSGSFSLPPDMAAIFADPVTILFGTAPNNTAGYGQYIDISSILITNVAGANESDDFTKDDVLNTGLWDPAFSLDGPSAVIQVSTNTPYWVTWTVPDQGFGLGTKASLNGGTNEWFTPNYYGGGTVTNTGPTQMGPSLKWTLIPSACLPTVDGTVGGTPSTHGFFRLSFPPPTQ